MSAATMQSVKPTNPASAYMGGKRLLAKRIISEIEKIDHTTYAEPFVGMGGVFLRRRSAPPSEVINDLNKDIHRLFLVLQNYYAYFVDYLKYQVASRAEFDRLKEQNPDSLTDIQRAARFLYLQRLSFGGKVTGRTFGVDRSRGSRFNISQLVAVLDDLHERLSGVTIECLPYANFIKRYDHKETLFYLDPPYWATEDYYDAPFSREDFQRLAEQLSGIKGKFIMSLNDTPGVRETFSQFRIEAVQTRYSCGKDASKKVGEVLITGT